MSSSNFVARGAREGSQGSQDIVPTKPPPKGKGKTATAASNSRMKADDLRAKSPPSKKAKGNTGAVNGAGAGAEEWDGEDGEYTNAKTKMTDEEQRKNFLQRNWYITQRSSTYYLLSLILT